MSDSNNWVSCALCGADDTVVVGRKGRFGVPLTNVVCKVCSLVYVNPRPAQGQLDEWYKNNYHSDYGGVGLPTDDGGIARPGTPEFDRTRDSILDSRAAAVGEWAEVGPRSRVLEVGCRGGEVLAMLRERHGCQVTGIEPGVEEAAQAAGRGIETVVATLEDAELGDRKFDVIMLFHVLEHFGDPLEALRILRKHVAEDGLLVVEVPNLYQPYGGLEDNFFQDAHLYNFSPWTLEWILEAAGFESRLSGSGGALFAMGSPDEPVTPDFAQGDGADVVIGRLHAYEGERRLRDALDRGSYDDHMERLARRLDSVDGGDVFRRRGLFDVAVAAVEAGRTGPALRWFERCYQLGDRGSDLVATLAQLSLIQGDGRRSKRYFKELRQKDPKHPLMPSLRVHLKAA